MLIVKTKIICSMFRSICPFRSFGTREMFVEQLNQRTILRLSGPDTVDYLQSMITNDVKKVKDSAAMYSLLLNARGRVLYDIILYRANHHEYFVEYDKTAVEYLHKHLFMYRLRKNVDIQLINDFKVWVIYPDFPQINSCKLNNCNTLVDFLMKQNGIIVSVIDPRTDLLGIRVITKMDSDLMKMLPQNIFKLSNQNSYRLYRYKLGIGEGVIDHPTGVSLPLETNVDYLNGVSFSKGCYIGQELTARSHFTMHIRKRLMPIILESKDTYPEIPAEVTVVNEKNEKLGRLRSYLGQFGLALLKYEDCLKAKYLALAHLNLKLEAFRPKWWPKDVNNK